VKSDLAMPRKLRIHERILAVVEYEKAINKFFSRRDALYILDLLLILSTVKYVVAEKLYRESKLYRSAVEHLKKKKLLVSQHGDKASILFLTEEGAELSRNLKELLEVLAMGD